MLEKGQVKARLDFAFEEKALKNVNRLVSYGVRGLIIVALIIGSCLLCTAPVPKHEEGKIEQRKRK